MIEKIAQIVGTKTTPSGILFFGGVIVSAILLSEQPYAGEIPLAVPYHGAYKNNVISTDFVDSETKLRKCDRSSECKTLAEAIVYEARGESDLGKVAVAHVIMARVDDGRWGGSIKKVVYQKHQFSYVSKKQKSKPSLADWKIAKGIAFDVLNGYIDSPVGDATHYHTTKVKPNWSRKLEYVATVDNHVFYR